MSIMSTHYNNLSLLFFDTGIMDTNSRIKALCGLYHLLTGNLLLFSCWMFTRWPGLSPGAGQKRKRSLCAVTVTAQTLFPLPLREPAAAAGER